MALEAHDKRALNRESPVHTQWVLSGLVLHRQNTFIPVVICFPRIVISVLS